MTFIKNKLVLIEIVGETQSFHPYAQKQKGGFLEFPKVGFFQFFFVPLNRTHLVKPKNMCFAKIGHLVAWLWRAKVGKFKFGNKPPS
jgi:hypothetical protein